MAEKLRAGITELADRIAEQKAYEISNRFFHGAFSPSNIGLDGRLLDYDTMTAQAHYMILISGNGDELGKTLLIKKELLGPLLDAMRKYLPKEDTSLLPLKTELYAHFDKEYAYRLKRNFVELTGVPPFVVTEMEKTKIGRAQIEKLGETLNTVAFTGAKKFVLEEKMPSEAPTYDLPRILVNLASRNPLDPGALRESVLGDIGDGNLRRTLINRYSAFMKSAVDRAASDGVKLGSFQTYTYENAKLRNADISDMHRPNLRRANERRVDAYRNSHDPSPFQGELDESIQRSRRNYRSDQPYELILNESTDPYQHRTSQQIFNAKTKKFAVKIQFKIINGEIDFFGNSIPLDEFKNAYLRTSANDWANEIQASFNGEEATFLIPTLGPPPLRLELALRSKDGTRWWKMGDQNAVIRFVEKGRCRFIRRRGIRRFRSCT